MPKGVRTKANWGYSETGVRPVASICAAFYGGVPMRIVLRVLALALTLAAAAGGGAALWWFAPWAETSPAKRYSVFDVETRIENFRHMDRLFPARAIPRTGPVIPLPHADAPLDVAYALDGQPHTLESFLVRTNTTGLLVIRDGTIVHEQYRLGADVSSAFTSWSVAKSFVATLIGVALHEGKIASLDDRADKYAPAYAGTPYGETTIRHLLMMASGIAFTENYADPNATIAQFWRDVVVFGQAADPVIARYGREAPQGTRFRYISTDSAVLGAVLRGATGRSISDYAAEKLWAKLGMEHDASWLLDGAGAELAFCCLNASLRDYAKLGLLYMNDGVWNGERLLPEGWVAMATRPNAPYQEPEAAQKIRGYGLHVWVPAGYDGEFFASGVWGQFIWVDQRRKVVIARTSVDPDFLKHLPETIASMRAIAAQVSETPPQP